jgi:hypothetical protein
MASTNFNRNTTKLNRTGGDGTVATHDMNTNEATAGATGERREAMRTLHWPRGTLGAVVEVINSAELAKRLGVPETWVRSRSNPRRTTDPIPHYKFGRYVQFPWGSELLLAWLNRQLVSTDRAGHSRRNE